MVRSLTPQQISQALQLRKEGYSIRDVANELGVPKSRIERLNLQSMSSPSVSFNPQPDSREYELSNRERQINQQQAELDAKRDELNQKARLLADQEQQILSRSNMFSITTREHTRQLDELAQRQQALREEQLAFEDRKKEIQQLLLKLPHREEQYESFRKRARQDKLVNRYNRLIQEILDNCDDCRWSGDDVDDFLERAESIKDKVVAFCDANQIDERRLLIYQGLIFIINDIEEEQEDQTTGLFSSASVDIDFSPEHQAKYTSYLVQSFDQEAPSIVPQTDVPSLASDDDEESDWDDEDKE
jgi:DNA repair exonuclease SbcCD ATPase subunit